MKKVGTIKSGYIGASVVMLLIGIILTVYPGLTTLALSLFVGAMILLFGISKLWGYFAAEQYRDVFRFDLTFGIIATVIGVLMLAHPQWLMSALPTLIGIFVLIDSVFSLQNVFEARRADTSYWWIGLVTSLITLVFGVLLIVDPFSGGEALIMVLGITLIVCAVTNFVTAIFISRRLKNAVKTEIYIDDNEDR